MVRRYLALLALAAVPLAAQSMPAGLFDGLSWRLIGPFRGGRTEAATGVAGDPNTFYFGAVGGGIWKTTDAGIVWKPIFDAQHVASIGALEVAPSDPNVIYAGTGEVDLRSDIASGEGIYRSADAGKTWHQVGLRDTRHIGRILIHPTNPDIVYVAALGHAYGPNEERGVFRTTDGGQSWQKMLFKDTGTGAVDLAWPPEDPRTIYATLWNVRRPARIQYGPVEGPGSGLYKTSDGGDTWTQIQGHGLPEGDWRRAGVAVAPGTGGRRVYALIDTKGAAGLYRSDDSGQTWTRPGDDPRVTNRGWYFGRVTVDPRNPDVVFLPNIAMYRTADGGKTFQAVRGAPGGDDYHLLWIDRTAPARMILASDQGAIISSDGGQSWGTWYNQPTAQMYHVIADNRFPYHVYGTQQDSGSVGLPSRGSQGQMSDADRYSVGGSESGYIAPDPADPNIIYMAGAYGGLTRFDRRTGQSQNISPWPAFDFIADLKEQKYRYPWTPPLVFSPVEPGILYFASQVLFRTANGGLDWKEISPDLTGPSKLGVIYTIAPSPRQAGVIWVGTDTGLAQVTRDGGKTWSNVTPPGVSEWSKITRIEASRFDPASAYAAVDRHRLDDFRPYLFRTGDYGRHWTAVTDGLQDGAFLNAVREDPVRRGMLYAATETGVYISFDEGGHWQPLQFNLPACSVRDIEVHGNDLVIATHGRSFWIMDDIAPLRQADAAHAGAPAWLYRPAEAVRTSREAFLGTPLPHEIAQAPNAPEGAFIDYYLAGNQEAVTLEILDSRQQTVRRYASGDRPSMPEHAPMVAGEWIAPPPRLTGRAGMNRFVWDLRYSAPETAGPQVLPGSYQVRLTVAGRSYTQPVTVKLDPRVTVSRTDLENQLDLGLKAAHALEDSARLPASPGLKKIQAELRSVLEATGSMDRRPPAQVWELYRQASARLADMTAGR